MTEARAMMMESRGDGERTGRSENEKGRGADCPAVSGDWHGQKGWESWWTRREVVCVRGVVDRVAGRE